MPTKPDLIKLMDACNGQIDLAAKYAEDAQWEQVSHTGDEITRLAGLLHKHYPTHDSRMEYHRRVRAKACVPNEKDQP